MQSRIPKPGDKVELIQKKHYGTGELTRGVVKDVLTKKKFHPRGHKVRLESGIIGRVQKYVDEDQKQKQESQTTNKSTPIGPHDLI